MRMLSSRSAGSSYMLNTILAFIYLFIFFKYGGTLGTLRPEKCAGVGELRARLVNSI